MKRSEAYKIRNGRVPMGNLAAMEGEARALGEYVRSAEPHYVRERRKFERALRLEKKARDARTHDNVVVRKKRSV